MSTKAKSDGLKVQVPTIPYEQTLRRLQRIQDHLSRPRSNRLKGKVCIVTGVGSLKGIGSVRALRLLNSRGISLTKYQQSGYSIAFCSRRFVDGKLETTIGRLSLRTGAKALYLLDFDGTNLPNLKETITTKYPDVHVR
jgi:hypothetical protein